MVKANAINYYSPARWVVSKKSGEGTHTTITAALSDASSGETVFVMSGTYTENLTLVPGVDITSLEESRTTGNPNVILIGKNTLTAAGSVVISGIRLQTNSDFILAVTGAAASQVSLINCFLDCTNNTGISFTSSDAGSGITMLNCDGNIGTVATTFFVSTAAGNIRGDHVNITNTGVTSTSSTSSVGFVSFTDSFFTFPFTVTGTASIGLLESIVTTAATDTTCITATGTGSTFFTPKVNLSRTFLDSKNAAGGAVAIASGSHVRMTGQCDMRSDGPTALSGPGTLIYTPTSFSTTTATTITTETPFAIGPEILVISNILTTGNLVSDIGSVTNQWKTVHAGNITFNGGSDFLDDYEEGTFTPTLIGSTGSIGVQTYASQVGNYIKIGNQVTLWGEVILTNKGSWTGIAVLAGFPFTGNASFTGGRQFVDGRDLTVTGAAPYLVTSDGTVASNTSVSLQAAGAGVSGLDQNYSDIANNTAIFYTFTYQE